MLFCGLGLRWRLAVVPKRGDTDEGTRDLPYAAFSPLLDGSSEKLHMLKQGGPERVDTKRCIITTAARPRNQLTTSYRSVCSVRTELA